MEEGLNIKLKSIAFDNLLLTANGHGSSLWTLQGTKNEDISDVQTVVMKGPFTKAESGLDVEVGDRVVITHGAKMMRVMFYKDTGEFVKYDPTKSPPKPEEVETYLLLSNRGISMVLED